MIRTIIVEDEMLVRIGLRAGVDWEAFGFELAGEAKDGREGLEMLLERRPHLALIDIRMPGMDGIELIGEAQKRGLPTKFVVLSCHDDFEYVRKAMQLGALDYLLKLSLSVADLEQLLLAVKEKLEALGITGDGAHPAAVPAAGAPAAAPYLAAAPQGGRSGKGPFYAVALAARLARPANSARPASPSNPSSPDSPASPAQMGRRQLVSNALAQVAKQQFTLSALPQYAEQNVYLLIQKDNVEVTRENLRNLGGRLIQSVALSTGESFLAGISERFSNWDGAAEAIAQARAAAEYAFYAKDGFALYRKPARDEADGDRQRFISAVLAAGTPRMAREQIAAYFERQEANPSIAPAALKALAIELVGGAMRKYDAGALDDVFVDIAGSGSFAGLKDAFFRFWDGCDAAGARSGAYSAHVRKAIDLVRQNYQDPAFAQNAVCHEISINQSYFCKLFKKEAGIPFVEYLNAHRVAKAIEYLAIKRYTVTETAFKCGYSNINYFSRVFKKVTGLAPTEIR
ncbi:MAG: response regulator [Clostridiales bacterium]|jgi:two-component system response regulator YesN|nr:response regulator [Clostridiales bacterium]